MNLFDDLEWTIANGLELFTFSLHPLFAYVQPYLISFLKLVINSMFVMPLLVLSLTLLKLFLNLLMNNLNFLNEISSLVNITMPINCNILLIDEF